MIAKDRPSAVRTPLASERSGKPSMSLFLGRREHRIPSLSPSITMLAEEL